MPDWNAIVRERLGGRAVDEDVVEEVVQHADDLFRAMMSSGRTSEESRVAVEQELADVHAVIRAARLRRRRRMVRTIENPRPGWSGVFGAFGRDLAHGARLLSLRPGFTAVAVLTLALGVGANTAIFSVIHAVLIDPLPFPEADRLVMIWERDADDPDRMFIVAAPNYRDWVASAKSFEATAIWEYQTFNVAGDAEPEQVTGMRVSSSLFTMLRVAPQIGRVFTPSEDVTGHDVVVISDRLWRSRFGGSADVLGRTVRLNGRPFEIIGVMPASFRFTQERHAIWVPIHFTDQDAPRDSHSFWAAARLSAGVSFDAAKAEIEAIGRQLAGQYEENRGETATITRLEDLGIRALRPTLLTLQGAVLLVALIACVNVANLLLAQASVRQREFTIRAALGAGRGRLASQLIAEGLVLAVAGGLAGVLLAWSATSVLSEQLPPAIRLAPFRAAGPVPLHPFTLVFTFVLAIVTGLIFSAAPVLALMPTDSGSALRAAGDRGGTPRLTTFRSTLVAVEVALALVVLVGAGLMIKSMARLVARDPGLDASNVLLMDMALPQADFYGPPERTTFCQDVDREVAPIAGVMAVGAISHLPLSGANASRGFVIDGRQTPVENGAGAAYRLTCPGYFRTFGIPLVKGRDFTHADSATALSVVIINEATAAAYWPDEDPLGRRIKFGDLSSNTPWLTIVGVAANVRHFGLDTDARREIYRPYTQAAWPVMTITVKSAVEPLALATTVRSALRRIDSDQPVSRIRTMQQVVAESMGSRQFPMLLLGIFAAISLLLATVGVYGVVACIVTQRAREIGIRMALGARRTAVVRMVVLRALVPIAIGLAAGTAVAVAASRQLSSLLFEVVPSDPAVLGIIAGVLGTAAMVASWIPARRAASVDPVVVLKES